MTQTATIPDMRTALYRHYDADGRLLYVGISLSPMSRTSQHAQGSEWFDGVVRVEIEWHENRSDALDAECIAIHCEKPLHNVSVNDYRLSCLLLGKRVAAKKDFCERKTALAQYMDEKGRGAAADLARMIGKSESTIWRLARGVTKPLAETALDIEDATGGAVPVRAWGR